MTREVVRLIRQVAYPMSYEQGPSYGIHDQTVEVVIEWPEQSLLDHTTKDRTGYGIPGPWKIVTPIEPKPHPKGGAST